MVLMNSFYHKINRKSTPRICDSLTIFFGEVISKKLIGGFMRGKHKKSLREKNRNKPPQKPSKLKAELKVGDKCPRCGGVIIEAIKGMKPMCADCMHGLGE
jgi:hypothetical protein